MSCHALLLKKIQQPAAAVTAIRHSLSVGIGSGPEVPHFFTRLFNLRNNDVGQRQTNAEDVTLLFRIINRSRKEAIQQAHSESISLKCSFVPFKMAFYSVFDISLTALECCLIYG